MMALKSVNLEIYIMGKKPRLYFFLGIWQGLTSYGRQAGDQCL